MTDKIVVLSTCGTQEEADRLATLLVEKRLAACVNVLPGVQSVYHWRGAVERSQEFLLVIKSSRELFDRLCTALSTGHTYETPEVIALPIVAGAEPYLEWLDRELNVPALR